jgi:hypothetical protein
LMTMTIEAPSGRTGHGLSTDPFAYTQDVGRDPRDRGAAWSPVIGVHYPGMTVLARARVKGEGFVLEKVEGMGSFLVGMYSMMAEVKTGTGAAEVRWEEPVILISKMGPLPESAFLEEGAALLLKLVFDPTPRQGTAHIRAHALRVEESYETMGPEAENLMRWEHYVLITATRAGPQGEPDGPEGDGGLPK